MSRSHRSVRQEPRRDKRMSQPVFEVHIEDRIWRTVNWSLGGLLLAGSGDAAPRAGSLVQGVIMPPAGLGESDGVPFMGRVTRLQSFRGEHKLALRFVGLLDPRMLALLERALQRRLGPTR